MACSGRGRWLRWNRRNTVEDYLNIDIRKLAKSAGLINRKFPLSWEENGQKVGEVDLLTSRNSVVMNYRLLIDGQWTIQKQTVSVTYTNCYFGRRRPWFSCPGCMRRCAILVLDSEGFYCRTCYQLLYRSQTAGKLDTLISQRSKLESVLFDDDWPIKINVKGKRRARLLARYELVEEKLIERFE